MLNQRKGALESKTIWGALLVILAPVLNHFFGIDLNEALQAEISGHLETILQAAGALLAIYGRIVAKSEIGPDKGLSMIAVIGMAGLLAGCAGPVVSAAERYCNATTEYERQAIRDRLGYGKDGIIPCP